VLQDVNLAMERGERLALVGANGAGKSTLMRLLAAAETPRRGTRREGHNLQLAYFAQDQARVLNPEATVLQQITNAAPFDMVPRVRDILGAFLFSGDDVQKPVAVLSGGEKNRLALAILLLRPANLLLLDEPTNHLDLQSKEVLLESLRHYRGSIVFVSHDRYFVDQLATRVVEVGAGKVQSYLGNYEDFLRAKTAQGDVTHSAQRVEQGRTPTAAAAVAVAGAQNQEERKAAKREQRRRQKEIEEIEACIEQREAELTAAEEQLADPEFYQDPDRSRILAARYQQLQEDVAALYQRWEDLQYEESA
jgi:ATP-binding cassette subfamily F protein 3